MLAAAPVDCGRDLRCGDNDASPRLPADLPGRYLRTAGVRVLFHLSAQLEGESRCRRGCSDGRPIARDDGRWANRSFVIDAAGNIRARYDKMHLFDVDLPSGESWREFSPTSQSALFLQIMSSTSRSTCLITTSTPTPNHTAGWRWTRGCAGTSMEIACPW